MGISPSWYLMVLMFSSSARGIYISADHHLHFPSFSHTISPSRCFLPAFQLSQNQLLFGTSIARHTGWKNGGACLVTWKVTTLQADKKIPVDVRVQIASLVWFNKFVADDTLAEHGLWFLQPRTNHCCGRPRDSTLTGVC